jgi:hypothetical protein
MAKGGKGAMVVANPPATGLEREGVVVCTYGPSGIGKTTDQGYSFPCAIFVAAPGALQSIKSVCGYVPATAPARSIKEATALIMQEAGNYKAIVIDDFSHMAEQTFSLLERKYKGFELWGRLRDEALGFRDAARYAGVDVVLNCWETGPRTSPTAGYIRGGPSLSGKLPETLPAMCDMVLRAGHDRQRKPWGGVYRCSSDPAYVMKDRYNIATRIEPAPMNLSEILRAAGVRIERHPDMVQYDDVIDDFFLRFVDTALAQQDVLATANELYGLLVKEGVAVPAARWILRDALDRFTIANALEASQSTFINNTGI